MDSRVFYSQFDMLLLRRGEDCNVAFTSVYTKGYEFDTIFTCILNFCDPSSVPITKLTT